MTITIIRHIFIFKYFIIIFPFFVAGCTTQQVDKNNEIQNPDNKKDRNDYYENGNIRIERKALSKGDTVWIFRQENGDCWEEDYFRDGEMYKKIVFNSDCSKSAEYELKNGKRHGIWKSFHENGKIREEGNYANGLTEGIFSYYDENGEIVNQEQSFILDSLKIPLFPKSKNNIEQFRLQLFNKPGFRENDNIEVAGKKEYHFPEIFWENSELHFDLKKENGNDTIKCVSGILNDKGVTVYASLSVGTPGDVLTSVFGIVRSNSDIDIVIHDLKEDKTIRFEVEHNIIKSIDFQLIESRY